MNKCLLTIISVVLLVSSGNSQNPKGMEYFELSRITNKNASSESMYYQFLDKPKLSAGLYQLDVNDVDSQKPHRWDEVYFITDGKASLALGGEVIEVKTGSIVYVRAQIPHHFFDLSENLKVLVIFSKSRSKITDPDWLAFKLDELIKKRETDKNVWNSFLNVKTMQMGLYILPKKIGGASIITGKGDGISIVVSGRGKLKAGKEKLDIQNNSIFYFNKELTPNIYEIAKESLYLLTIFQNNE